MVRLGHRRQSAAFASRPIEIERRGRSYTDRHAARACARGSAAEPRSTLLIGLDAFREIGTWKDYRIAVRAGRHRGLVAPAAARGRARARSSPLPLGRTFATVRRSDNVACIDTGNQYSLLDCDRARRFGLRHPPAPRSAGSRFAICVPPAVERYLTAHGLYPGGAPRLEDVDDRSARDRAALRPLRPRQEGVRPAAAGRRRAAPRWPTTS